jgi:hypothetical protein
MFAPIQELWRWILPCQIFAFVEPYANKLRDGVYSVYAVMSVFGG